MLLQSPLGKALLLSYSRVILAICFLLVDERRIPMAYRPRHARLPKAHQERNMSAEASALSRNDPGLLGKSDPQPFPGDPLRTWIGGVLTWHWRAPSATRSRFQVV